MRSHELAQMLLAQPDVELLMQEDPAGNGYRKLSSVDFDIAVQIDGRDIEVFSTNDGASDHCMDDDEWLDVQSTGAGYAVLYP